MPRSDFGRLFDCKPYTFAATLNPDLDLASAKLARTTLWDLLLVDLFSWSAALLHSRLCSATGPKISLQRIRARSARFREHTHTHLLKLSRPLYNLPTCVDESTFWCPCTILCRVSTFSCSGDDGTHSIERASSLLLSRQSTLNEAPFDDGAQPLLSLSNAFISSREACSNVGAAVWRALAILRVLALACPNAVVQRPRSLEAACGVYSV